jgi:predicted TIM-barrel fold metal-dependent hydrolase
MCGALGACFTTRAGTRPKDSVTTVDTHAHIFARDLKLAGQRRYSPDYDATLDEYLQLLDSNAISHGVLIQPSFLGTDNSYLTAALRQCPARLRGIAVVETTAGERELAALAAAGVVGIRLNMVGSAAPDLTSKSWQTLIRRAAKLHWQVEVQKEARDLPAMIPALLDAGVNVVVDHFGRPDSQLGIEDPGFRFLLSTAQSRKVWVKLSGAYRNGADGTGEKIAQQAIPPLRQAFGPSRLIWGSDWPHTQFEKTVNFTATRREFDSWIQDPAERRAILVDTPVDLFRF